MGGARLVAGVAFVVAAALRILFWLATDDRGLAHSAAFRGDAALWLEYARWFQGGPLFELGLPIQPPGTAWLVSALWDGTPDGVFRLRLAWSLLGAGAVALFTVAVHRSFGSRPAWIAGMLMAASTGLIVLSSSIDAETPYLVLVSLAILLWPTAGRSWPAVVAASIVHGLGCLVRVEHVLFYALFLLVAFRGSSNVVRRVVVSLAIVVATLMPWHVRAWSRIERFNTEKPADESAWTAERVMASLGEQAWDDEARAEAARLPAFARPTATVFVAATVAHRGRRVIIARDFGILDDAFGYRPRPIGPRPFISLYGPLNFALANDPRGDGGFTRALLEDPPRLFPARSAYPEALVVGLPPADLSFVYPPHLALLNDGYRITLESMARAPSRHLQLVLRKLHRFVQGAALGFTGYGFPLGAASEAHAVDLALPAPGVRSWLWLGLVVVACAAGFAAARGNPFLTPWLVFAGCKVTMAMAFFGYARQGAQIIPVVALLMALGLRRAFPALDAGMRATVLATMVAATCLVSEAVRFLSLRP